jgi:hypothetical protein
MNDFIKTLSGRKFLEGDVPKIAKSLGRIAGALEKIVDLNNGNNKAVQFLQDIMNEEVDMTDGEALDHVYQLLINPKNTDTTWGG